MGKYKKSQVNGNRGITCIECGRFMPDRTTSYIAHSNGILGSVVGTYCSEGCAKNAGHTKSNS